MTLKNILESESDCTAGLMAGFYDIYVYPPPLFHTDSYINIQISQTLWDKIFYIYILYMDILCDISIRKFWRDPMHSVSFHWKISWSSKLWLIMNSEWCSVSFKCKATQAFKQSYFSLLLMSFSTFFLIYLRKVLLLLLTCRNAKKYFSYQEKLVLQESAPFTLQLLWA